jgi:hypothetical protein
MHLYPTEEITGLTTSSAAVTELLFPLFTAVGGLRGASRAGTQRGDDGAVRERQGQQDD